MRLSMVATIGSSMVFCILQMKCGHSPPDHTEPAKKPSAKSTSFEIESSSPAFGLTPIGPEKSDPLVFDALEKAEQGELEVAIKMLLGHVERVPNALFARINLGHMLDFDGRREEAIQIWKDGLSGTTNDYIVWMTIGRARYEQAKDGPLVKHRRGTVTYLPNHNAIDENLYKTSHGKKAFSAFEKAAKADPSAIEPIIAMASTKYELDDFEHAAQLWKEVCNKQPDNGDALLSLAQTLTAAGKTDEAAESAKQALQIQPRLSAAYQILSEYYQDQNDLQLADHYGKMADYYQWFIPNHQSDYTEDNYNHYRVFSETTSHNQNEAIEKIRTLSQKDTQFSRDVLATIAWRHEMHGEMEQLAYATLEQWRASDTLFSLIEHAQSTCTIRGAAYALSRLKDDRILDWLIQELPRDVNPVHYVDIAGAISLLGDTNGVPALVAFVQPTVQLSVDSKNDDFMIGYGKKMARARAILALGSFQTESSMSALRDGLHNPQIGIYCHAALYRLTHNDEHASALKAFANQLENNTSDHVFPSLIADYLEAIATKEAAMLSKQWQELGF